MRFRINPIVFSLLCSFAQQAVANVDLCELRIDKTFMKMSEPTQETPTFVEADKLSGKKENQIEATGNAILRKRGQSIRADRLLYFQQTEDVDAQGSVVLEQDGSTMSGPHLRLNLSTSIGEMEQPVYYIAESGGRGTAEMLHIQDKQHYTLDKANYTTCPAGNRDWLLKMSELEIDRDRQIGVAHHARVEFMNVPILYSPWMDFALNDQRKSGFMSPVFGSTVKGGSELTLPYYWNIAPNRDATIAPRAIKKRGLMLNNEFRYLEQAYGGEMHVDVLPDDALANRNRGRFALKHSQHLAAGWNGYVDFNHVSDDNYFRDLADAVTATSQVNLLQKGVLSYSDVRGWSTSLRVQRYQTLQDIASPITEPYARMPQVTVNAQQKYANANLAFAGEYVDFSHPTLVNGKRLVLNPSASYSLVNLPAYYLTPKIGLHTTYYSMGANQTAEVPYSSRAIPILSVDSGVAFERELNLFGSEHVHTLEPRAFYVYVPYKDQSGLPNFDSSQADFSFTQMFNENRFFGSDRVGDANHLTLAMTSRLIEQENGVDRLKVTVGERFSLQPPKVYLTTPAASNSRSDVLLAADGRVTRSWSFDSELQYDPNQTHTQRYNIAAHYRPEAGKALNFGYRFLRDTLRIADVSAQWPLSNRWYAVGKWNYSVLDGLILETVGGLEYNQDCWTLRFVVQRFTTATEKTNTGFFLQLELNDLIKVGSDPLDILKQSIYGYTKMNDKDVINATRASH